MLSEPNLSPGVGAILIHNNTFLLQLRDNIPTISNPNKWGLIGGAIEAGETPDQAMRRECIEEIGIIPHGLTYLGHTKDNKFRFYAYLSDEEVKKLVKGEGQEINFFALDEIFNLSVTPRVEQFIKTYPNAARKFIAREKMVPEDLGLEV